MIFVQTTRHEERGFVHKSRFGRFVGGVVGGVAGSRIPVFSTVAGIAQTIGGAAFGAGSARARPRIPPPPSNRIALPPGLTPRGPGGIIGAIPGVPGGVTGFQADQGAVTGLLCPRGMHVNRSSYFLSSGEHVPKESRCVRNRTRNLDNGKATKKAASRLAARAKQNKKTDAALASLAPPRRRSSTKSSSRNGGGPIVVAS